MNRLFLLKKKHPEIRTFLYIISEASLPKPYVSEEGKGKTSVRPIEWADGFYKVRRVCKAAHAFDRRDKAQYACLIEVYVNSPKKKPKTLTSDNNL